ncbi:scaffoldin [Piromyces finnis]|uniref:Scaffoldin n=1 Tax=Piromyces finnis TaxID=1754191 RepID=A0A1Y1UUY3_9FUNG|nr:scaffoldin [Piromyces finnis]|eukprot:ORX41823.1 scaffoldin [Piromyces finnis]
MKTIIFRFRLLQIGLILFELIELSLAQYFNTTVFKKINNIQNDYFDEHTEGNSTLYNNIPIKYWTDDEKLKLLEMMEDNVFISSNSLIENFTNFYNQLNDREKEIYKVLYNGSVKELPDFDFKITLNNFNGIDEVIQFINTPLYSLEKVYTALIYENPGIWWISSFSGSYSYNETSITFKLNLHPPNDKFSGYTSESIAVMNKEIVSVKERIIKQIDQKEITTKYGILRYIHDYLVENIEYVLDENRIHIRNIYGSIVENICVCEGYAEAIQYIAHHYNIDCIIARSIDHEWNLVKMDNGKWYILDVTWDDPINDKENLNYFLSGTKHVMDEHHYMVYSAFGNIDLVKYPQIEEEKYTPSSDRELYEKNLVNNSSFDLDDGSGEKNAVLSTDGTGTLNYYINNIYNPITSKIGYFKSSVLSKNQYIQCLSNNNCNIIRTEISSCNDESIGMITTNGTVCLFNDRLSQTFGVIEVKYLIKYKEKTISENIGEEGGYGLLSVTLNSILLENIESSYSSMNMNNIIVKISNEDSEFNIYNCDTSSGVCINNNGYHLLDSSSGSFISDNTNSGTLIECTGMSPSFKCTNVQSPAIGYYNNTETERFIECSASNDCKLVTGESSCNSSTIGKIVNDGSICLNENVKTSGSGEYLIKNGNESIFKADYILIKVESNSITFKTLDKEGDYCVENSNLVASTRFLNRACTEGSTRYSCKTTGICNVFSPPIVNIDPCNDSILNANQNSNFNTDSYMERVKLNPGILLYFFDGKTIYLKSKNESIHYVNDSNITKFALINCDENKCKQTHGYIKEYNNSIYLFGKSKSDIITTKSLCSESGDILTSNYSLCKNSGDTSPLILNSSTSETNYIINVSNVNEFTNSSGNILIKSANNIFYLDNFNDYDEDYCLNNSNLSALSTSSICTEGTTRYTCKTTGICELSLVTIDQCTNSSINIDFSKYNGDQIANNYCIKDNKIIALKDKTELFIISEVFTKGINLIKFDGNNVTPVTNVSNENVSDITRYALMNCNESQCKQTYGYIKVFNDNVYLIGKSKKNTLITTESSCTKYGDITTDYKLCRDNIDSSPIEINSSTTTTNYVINVENENEFTKTNGAIFIRSVSNIIYLDNINVNENEKFYILNTENNLKLYKYSSNDKTVTLETTKKILSFNSIESNDILVEASIKTGFAIYQCDASICHQIIGYFLLDSSTGVIINDTNTAGTLVSCRNDQSIVCEDVQSPAIGYYLNAADTETNKFIKYTASNCKLVVGETSCDSSTIGEITTDGKLCLDNNIKTNNNGNYIVKYREASIFTTGSKNMFELVEVMDNSITLKILNIDSDYCVINSSLITLPISSACSEDSTRYTCKTTGICELSSVSIPKCAGNENTSIHVNEYNIDNIDGYCIKDKEIIAKVDSTAQFITELNLSSGIHLLKFEGKNISEISSISTITIDSANIKKYALINCDDERCEQTFGYVKDRATTYLIGKSESRAITPKSSCETFGDIITSFKLCINNNGDNALEFNSGNNTNNYIIAASAHNEFTGISSETSILIRLVSNIIYFESLKVNKNNGLYIIIIDDVFKLYEFNADTKSLSLQSSIDQILKFDSIDSGSILKKVEGFTDKKTIISKCKQSSGICTPYEGYILLNENNNELISDNTTSGILIKCTISECEKEKVSATGYYINAADTETNKFIECSANNDKGCKLVTGESSCIIGKIINDGKLCLDNANPTITTSAIGTPGLYLISYNEKSIFSEIQNNEYGLIDVKNDSIVLKTLESANEYCTMNSSLEVSIMSSMCSLDSKRYICKKTGICSAYIPPVTVNECSDEIKNNESYNSNLESNSYCITGKKIISLNNNNTPVSITESDLTAGIHLIKFDGSINEVSLIKDESINENDIKKYALINCDDKKCKQTYGYVKDRENSYLIGKSESRAIIPKSSCSAFGDILTSSFNLCIDSNNNTLNLNYENNAKNYIITAPANNKFTEISLEASIFIRAASNVFYFENLKVSENEKYYVIETEGKLKLYKYTSENENLELETNEKILSLIQIESGNILVEASEVSESQELAVYTCSKENCVPTYGYFLLNETAGVITTGAKTPSTLLKCTGTSPSITCNIIQSPKESENENKYYVNAGTSIKLEDSLIECNSYGCQTKNLITVVDGNKITEVFFKNENYGLTDELDATNYLIKCSKVGNIDNGCVPYASTSLKTGTEWYIHGAPNNGSLQKAVIKVTIKDTTSEKRSEKSNINVELINPSEGDIYLNSFNNKNIIQCYNNACKSIKGNGTDDIPGFYINAGTDTSKSSYKGCLIKCDSKNDCYLYNTDDNNDLIKDNDVFINANYKENSLSGDAENRLIICADNECKAKNISVEENTGNKYFINGSTTTSETYSNLLIQCRNSGACTPTDGGLNYIYLNGNFNSNSSENTGPTDSTNHLIICNNSKCEIQKSSATANDNEYYVNSNIYTENSSNESYPLILCKYNSEISKISCVAETVTVGASTSQDVFYINANYGKGTDKDMNYLIHCSSSNTCNTYSNTNAIENTIEYYVHGAPLESNFSASIISCKIKSIDANNNVSIDDDTFSKCTLFNTPKENDIYINSYNGNLIRCYGSNTCEAFNGPLGNSNVSAFFINGSGNNESENVSYKGLLIKCSGSGNCVEYGTEIKDYDVFINSNYIDSSVTTNNYGDTTNRLIICSEYKCNTSDIDTSIKERKESNVYYVNGGATITEPYKNLLIKCLSSGGACTIESSGENYVYLNGNQPVDNNYLIGCYDGICTTINGKSSSTKEYYNNAGASDENKLVEGMIYCNTSQCTVEDITEKINNDDKEIFYINKNYNNHDNINYLIKCSANGCVPYSNKNPNKNIIEHYVHGDSTDLTDAIIKVSFTDSVSSPQSGKEKNSVTLRANVEFVTTAAVNNIYINSYNKALIHCYDTKCTSYGGIGSSHNPIFYINAETANTSTNNERDTISLKSDNTNTYIKLLIKCEETCKEVDGHANDVYLNANLKTTTNEKSTDNNQLIICAEGKCLSTANTVSSNSFEYYVNAGAYDSKSLVNTLIECSNPSTVSCVTKDISNIIDGIKVHETFFLNKNYDTINYDKINYLIRCSKDNGCHAYSNNNSIEGKNEYYINGGKTEKLADSLIQCEIKSNKTAICTTSQDTTKASDKQIYLNAANATQIIRCTKQEGCLAAATNPTDTFSEYYINGGDTTNMSLIKCSKANQCVIIKNEFKTGCHIYLNANYLSTADTQNHLIRCLNGICELTISTAIISKPQYFVNSDETNDKILKDDLIKCTNNNSIIDCKVESAQNDDVYLNAAYEATKNNKPIILCQKGESCKEVSVTSDINNYIYYVNAGHTESVLLKDTIIQCSDKCEIYPTVNNDVYINAFNNSQIIYCTEQNGCKARNSFALTTRNEIYLNASDLTKNPHEIEHIKDLIICSNNGKMIKCELGDGQDNGIYINSSDIGDLIQCREGKPCEILSLSKDIKGFAYFVNYDSINNKDDPLVNNLIRCKSVQAKIICDIINGHDGDVYLNSSVDLENNTPLPLIICDKEKGCILSTITVTDSKLSQFFVNSGNYLPNHLNDTLIQCSYSSNTVTCNIQNAQAKDVYVNYGSNKKDYPLIKCSKNNGCQVSISSPTLNSNEYYINAGDLNKNSIIECSSKENETTTAITCTELYRNVIGYYLNSNYAKDNHQLIQCTNIDGCKIIRIDLPSTVVEYYVNAEKTDSLVNAVISCSNHFCEKITPSKGPTYYLGKNEDELYGLIVCNTSACLLKRDFTSQGYYLNSGYNQAINQTIICNEETGCETRKVDIGYYVNAGDPENPVIKCGTVNGICIAEKGNCPKKDEDAVGGNYCYKENKLLFYPQKNSTAIYTTNTENYYTYSFILAGNFPGITKDMLILFKITQYTINRFYQSGVVVIDKNGKLVKETDKNEENATVYDCDSTNMECIIRPECTPYTYLYNSENKEALFCNENKHLSQADVTGYVITSNLAGRSKHASLIKCENKGTKCRVEQSKVTSYYENNGYDSDKNSLIQCSNNVCATKTVTTGFYLAHDGAGIIYCNGQNSCSFTEISSQKKIIYVNAGENRDFYPLIECSKQKGCKEVKGKVGYYLTYNKERLIQCTSSSLCVEIIPSVNYYNNADSSENSNGLINCTENGNTINCDIEESNTGFYISNNPSVLISCKDNGKCKYISITNGIFRSALRNISDSNKKRENEVEKEFYNLKSNSSHVNKELSIDNITDNNNEFQKNEELQTPHNEKIKISSRDSNESYGIIRCVLGKCNALTTAEIDAIPICEYDNRKCYITQAYAIKKSATTNLEAGNICTDETRSVFYFATDNVVVKPNVIDSKIATYKSTTTITNCVEVTDDYSDNYFAVGSNIYLLDKGSVLQFVEAGNYFINTKKNIIVKDKEITSYNDENVKLYSCNGSSCHILDTPTTQTYFTDANKRIFVYNTDYNGYKFAYDKDIICIFKNNKCTPNADMNDREFCITYKGELAVVRKDIKNHETGECFKATSITKNIYGYGKYLYSMSINKAERIETTGYHLISRYTNSTIQYFRKKIDNILIYGCEKSICKVYEPENDSYYYDEEAKLLLRYNNNEWKIPENSGYALISTSPDAKYIYKIEKSSDNIITFTLGKKAALGYYYTIDEEMYHCQKKKEMTGEECKLITNSEYILTQTGEIYNCIYDSEELEPTECSRYYCAHGQYYFIENQYYYCESNGRLTHVMARHCYFNKKVVVNFPVALTKEYPEEIQSALSAIINNNNSTAVLQRRHFLDSVVGVYTNCTYNAEEKKADFNLVCINNFVQLDHETKDLKICSIEKMGYAECEESEENPEKLIINECTIGNVNIGLSSYNVKINAFITSEPSCTKYGDFTKDYKLYRESVDSSSIEINSLATTINYVFINSDNYIVFSATCISTEITTSCTNK